MLLKLVNSYPVLPFPFYCFLLLQSIFLSIHRLLWRVKPCGKVKAVVLGRGMKGAGGRGERFRSGIVWFMNQTVNGVGARLSDANYTRVRLYYTILVDVTYGPGSGEFVHRIHTYKLLSFMCA